MKQINLIILLACILNNTNAQNFPTVSGHDLEYRMVRISTNFLVDSNLPNTLDVITRASESCYNGVLLSDVKFGFLDDFANSPNYFQNLNTFLDSAKVLGLEVYPETTPFGYSESLLHHNPNLAEGLPVVDAPFVVQQVGNQLALVNDPNDVFPLLNADFEETPNTANTFPNWSWQDEAGVVTFWDNTQAHSGNASARISDPNGNGRIVQSVDVQPFRDYHLSAWLKTENFNSGFVNILVYNTSNNRIHHYNPIYVNSTQDWTQYDITFNTLDAENLTLYFGVWGGGTGSLWFDDIQIEPTRFNNILRREGTPLEIKKADGTVLTEGVDTDPIVDPLLGMNPWSGSYSIWHEQPNITIPSNSSLQVGDQVLAKYYHTAIIYDGQVTASLTDPAVFDITALQLTQIRDAFVTADMFDGWFLQYDEIRLNNWDESPNYGSPGENLAFNFTTVYNQAKAIDSNSKLMTWSDMFDPFHNAYSSGDPYYLVNGFWNGSWEGVPSDVMIMNWYSGSDRINSGQFFSNRGHEQILAGYYDEGNFYTGDWLADLTGTDGIKGVMYTTWVHNFEDLENWAEAIWGTCDFVTSSDEIFNNNTIVSITPNPTSSNFKIEVNGETIEKVEVYNSIGEILLEKNNAIISIEHLPVGVYFVKIQTNKGFYSSKIKKE